MYLKFEVNITNNEKATVKSNTFLRNILSSREYNSDYVVATVINL
jgi:hypothetical protein